MSKKFLILFCLLFSCNQSSEKLLLDCKKDSIEFLKKKEISINTIPSKFIKQQLAELAFQLPKHFKEAPVVNVTKEDAGILEPVCTLKSNFDFLIGSSNKLAETIYISEANTIHAVPMHILNSVSLNFLDYLTLFSEKEFKKFSLKEGNQNHIYTRKQDGWYLDNIKLNSEKLDLLGKELISNKFKKHKVKRNPTFILVTDLNVLEIEIDKGVWVSTPELNETFLSNIPEELFIAGSAGLGRDRSIFKLSEISSVKVDGFDSNFEIISKDNKIIIDGSEADDIFAKSYLEFLKSLKLFYFSSNKTLVSKASIVLNDSEILEVGEYFVLPNADLGYYAKYRDSFFVLSERQIKKMFPKKEIFLKIK